MASFDIIQASGQAYRFVWRERRYLMHLALVPLIIKLACYGVVILRGWHENLLWQALVMLPSYFADGWMLSHLVRLIFLNQRWPFRPVGDDEVDRQRLFERARGILAGTVCFVVIKFLVAGLAHFIYIQPFMAQAASGEPQPAILVAALALFVGGVWGFRFLWFYIPAALEYPLGKFRRDLRGFSTSFYLMGTWFICFLPVFTLFRFLTSFFLAPYGYGNEVDLPLSAQLPSGVLAVLMDMTDALLSTAGIAFGASMIINRGQSRR